jgi:hypothetical protein
MTRKANHPINPMPCIVGAFPARLVAGTGYFVATKKDWP